jgi:phage host-nuclease inhibitor protein Gam
LKFELAEEKTAREEAQAEVETLARAIGDLKKTVDKFATQVPELEEKFMDGLNKLCAKELSLERTTKVNEDYNS